MNYQQWLASLTPGQKQQISSTGMGFPDEFRRLQAGGPLMSAPAENYYESQNPYGALTGVRDATARSRAATQAALAQQKESISSAQQQLYQQSQNNRDILPDKSFRDPYSWEGEYMPPMVKGQDNLSENLEQRYGKDTERLKRFEAANAMILDANGYAPGAASAPAGPPSDPAQDCCADRFS